MVIPASESNESLFVRFRSDADPETFRLLFSRTAPRLARLGRRMGVPDHELDDVVQETYLAALVGAARFDASLDLSEWLAGIMFKKAIDVRRPPVARAHRSGPTEGSDDEGAERAPRAARGAERPR